MGYLQLIPFLPAVMTYEAVLLDVNGISCVWISLSGIWNGINTGTGAKSILPVESFWNRNGLSLLLYIKGIFNGAFQLTFHPAQTCFGRITPCPLHVHIIWCPYLVIYSQCQHIVCCCLCYQSCASTHFFYMHFQFPRNIGSTKKGKHNACSPAEYHLHNVLCIVFIREKFQLLRYNFIYRFLLAHYRKAWCLLPVNADVLLLDLISPCKVCRNCNPVYAEGVVYPLKIPVGYGYVHHSFKASQMLDGRILPLLVVFAQECIKIRNEWIVQFLQCHIFASVFFGDILPYQDKCPLVMIVGIIGNVCSYRLWQTLEIFFIKLAKCFLLDCIYLVQIESCGDTCLLDENVARLPFNVIVTLIEVTPLLLTLFGEIQKLIENVCLSILKLVLYEQENHKFLFKHLTDL